MVGGTPPFADHPAGASFPYPDCPFSRVGGPVAGSSELPRQQSRPTTRRSGGAAENRRAAGRRADLRASDGCRVRNWEAGLVGAGMSGDPDRAGRRGLGVRPGQWGSIRTGESTGTASGGAGRSTARGCRHGRTTGGEGVAPVAAVDAAGVGGDPWLSHPEYYSTIRAGDVDGDGRDDVIARGPFGIRTWFYNRRETGGWERYLPDGYPAFVTAGQKNAFTALTHWRRPRVIPDGGDVVRDAWASDNAPAQRIFDRRWARAAWPRSRVRRVRAPGNPPATRRAPRRRGAAASRPRIGPRSSTRCSPRATPPAKWSALFATPQHARESVRRQARRVAGYREDLGLQGAAGSTATFERKRIWSGASGSPAPSPAPA